MFFIEVQFKLSDLKGKVGPRWLDKQGIKLLPDDTEIVVIQFVDLFGKLDSPLDKIEPFRCLLSQGIDNIDIKQGRYITRGCSVTVKHLRRSDFYFTGEGENFLIFQKLIQSIIKGKHSPVFEPAAPQEL